MDFDVAFFLDLCWLFNVVSALEFLLTSQPTCIVFTKEEQILARRC